MAFNYGNTNQQFYNQSQPTAAAPMPQMAQQNVQPLFPQPQGNVYNINSTLEVANVPVGAGISVALCLNEGLMYIKTMQNGNPLFWAYKITPFDSSNSSSAANENENKIDIAAQFEQYDNRFIKIEQKLNEVQETIAHSNKKGGWDV